MANKGGVTNKGGVANKDGVANKGGVANIDSFDLAKTFLVSSDEA